ncbi:hypothetical protein [Pseudonocardia halophobica]|nr:hypothetical protein [Pseudonocardia halophobica]
MLDERAERERARREVQALHATARLDERRRRVADQIDSLLRSSPRPENGEALERKQEAALRAATEEELLVIETDLILQAIRRPEELGAKSMAEVRAAADHARRMDGLAIQLDRLQARHARLLADATAARVVTEDLEILEREIEAVARKLRGGPLEPVEVLVRGIDARLAEAEQELDTAIDRTVARREMLGAIIEALPELGYSVDPATLAETANGTISVHARRLSGAELTVVVGEGGGADPHRVDYIRPGEVFARSPSMPARDCSSLQRLADRLNDSLRTSGYLPGKVSWDGDGGGEPHRRRRAEVPMPRPKEAP